MKQNHVDELNGEQNFSTHMPGTPHVRKWQRQSFVGTSSTLEKQITLLRTVKQTLREQYRSVVQDFRVNRFKAKFSRTVCIFFFIIFIFFSATAPASSYSYIFLFTIFDSSSS